jgi:hypothetical protein
VAAHDARCALARESLARSLASQPQDGGRRVNLPGDPEHECRASRTTRETIAAQHGRPPSWGWLARERANDSRARAQRASWAATPSGARARRRAGLRTAPGTSIVPRDYGVPAPMPVGLGAR